MDQAIAEYEWIDMSSSELEIDSVFFHVPKAAGTSIKAVFINYYGRDRCLRVWQGADVEVPDLVNFAGGERRISCVLGHFSIPHFAQNSDLIRGFERSGRFALTAVREPLERLVSDYYYIANRPTHPRFAQVEGGLERYLEQAPANSQSNFLGVSGVDVEDRAIHFQENNCIANRLIILSTKFLDQPFSELTLRAFGDLHRLQELNRASAPAKRALPDRLIVRFQERNKLDYDLFQLVDLDFTLNQIDSVLPR